MDNPLSTQFDQGIRPCIDLIDSLRAFGVDKDIGLPAIAVIGDQSSGKSSVLEALSGVSLPRGTGIVTRCPLEMKLKNVKKDDVWKGKISYGNYTNEISSAARVEAQNTIIGNRLGISKNLISLEIESSNVPDLTMIDLPGIARVAVGNQPHDIGDQIKKLIKLTIQKKETINLVVVPCNVDIATTEALKMAQEVDPSGDRTLGILTKPDLIDKGTEVSVVNVMQNMVVELKKGYMMVKCRGQKDINNQMIMSDAILKEKEFFEGHEHFGHLLEEGKAGIPCLAARLTKELVAQITKTLPELRKEVERKLDESLKSFKKYSYVVPTSDTEKIPFIIEKLNQFCTHLKRLTSGEEPQDKINGMRYITCIRKEFEDWKLILSDSETKVQELMNDTINKYEASYRGRELPGFVNYKTFESLIKNELSQLERPAIEKLKIVTEITKTIFMKIAEQHFSAFCHLLKIAKVKIATIAQQQECEAEKLLQNQFKVETVVYSQDSHYSKTFGKLRSQGSSKNYASIQEMSFHLKAYFKIVSSLLADQIPKVIWCYILNEFSDKLWVEMLQIIQEKNCINKYLLEDEDTQRERETLKCKIDRLRKAQNSLLVFG